MKWLIAYGAFQLVFLVLFLVLSKRKDKRLDVLTEAPADFIATSEIFIDPVSKEQIQVYVHPETGKRVYVSKRS